MTDISEMAERPRTPPPHQLWAGTHRSVSFIRDAGNTWAPPHYLWGSQRIVTLKTSRKTPGIPLPWSLPPAQFYLSWSELPLLESPQKAKSDYTLSFWGSLPRNWFLFYLCKSSNETHPDYSRSLWWKRINAVTGTPQPLQLLTLAQCRVHGLTLLWEGETL